jgi:hypothetical protein
VKWKGNQVMLDYQLFPKRLALVRLRMGTLVCRNSMQQRPTPGTHIGALVSHDTCAISFDLVPDERINGAPQEQA